MAATVTVHIPTPLRGQVEGQARVELAGGTVREVLIGLAERYPRLRGRLLDERNQVNRFVNVFLNEEDVRFLDDLDTPVNEGDGIMIVPAIAGGSCGAGGGPQQKILDGAAGCCYFQSVIAERALCCCCSKARDTSRDSNRSAFVTQPD